MFDLDFHVETRVYECNLGLIGLFVGTIDPTDDDDPNRTASTDPIEGDDFRDCYWIRYYPQLPIWGITFKPEWDRVWDYYEWNCNYYDDSDRWDGEDPSNVVNDDINGFGEVEPSNFAE